MKRILTTLALASALLLTAAAQEKKPALGTLMLNKDFSPTALEAGEQLYYPVLLHCDTTQITRLFHQWNQYVDQHPQDEAAWRNFYEVYEAYYLRSFNAPGGRTKQELARQTNLQERLARGIPYTYTYDIIALQEQFSMTGEQEHSRSHMHKYAVKALERLPDDARASDLQLLIGTLYQTGDTTNLKQLLNIYFDRDMCPSYVLQYHFNELQGMEQNAVYIGTHEGDIIPKLVIQYVLRQHRDKLLYDQNFCYDRIYNAACFSHLGIAEPDYDAWIRSGESWNRLSVEWLCDNSPRPVYFSSNSIAFMAEQWLTDDLKACLYNEGLTMRYSPTPYDNFKVKRRNIDKRYLLEYLLYPFESDHDVQGQRWNDDRTYLALNYVMLLQDQLPWYEQNDPEGYDRLAHLIRRILKQNTDTDAAEEDIPPMLKLPRLVFFSEKDSDKEDSMPSITVEEETDADGNKTVTKTTIITSNEQKKISWKK
ncbi:MAG: hypothetical protein J6M41_05720 [Prevotella sp.]|nr:hypothetical protein [Prevotella sp.]